MSGKEYCVEWVALYFTMKTSFRHLYYNKDEEWAKKTLEGLNKILNCHQCLKNNPTGSTVKPGEQTGDDVLSMPELITIRPNLNCDKAWKYLFDDCYIGDDPFTWDMRKAIYGTIETSFKHVYENKEQEWAKQTLEGLRKLVHYGRCCNRKKLITPGKQKGCIDLTMEVLGYLHYDDGFCHHSIPG